MPAPRKHIRPHRGPIRGIVRFYMALSMPLDMAALSRALILLVQLGIRARGIG